jgi:RNA polymerase sigma factor (TIGR02999 family)
MYYEYMYDVRRGRKGTAAERAVYSHGGDVAMHIVESRNDVVDLLPKVYDELRRIAAAQLGCWSASHTIQPTELVHEAWLRLGGADPSDWVNRAHFVAAAAESMRHILIDRARQRRAVRHGGGQQRVDLESVDPAVEGQDIETLLALNTALDKLADQHLQMANLVKLHCFVGLEITQAALALGISRATATRWWQFARTWLYRELHA